MTLYFENFSILFKILLNFSNYAGFLDEGTSIRSNFKPAKPNFSFSSITESNTSSYLNCELKLDDVNIAH